MPASGVNSAYNRITALFHNTTGVSSLITIVVLSLASLAGIVSRLFSVIRFESSIAGYDPWFNYRATAYMVQHGFYNFFNWFDERAWYPLGRHVGATVYPGLMITSGAIHWVLYALNIPVHIRDVCVFVTPVFSGLTAIASYLLTSELWSRGAGLYAACFIAIIPGYSSRSVAGCYENEGIAIFALQFTFYLWLKSVKTGSVFWSVCTALSYFYMVSAWGGYVFIINLIPLHVFVLLIMGRFSQRLFVSYSVFYIVGLLCSMQIPFVGFQAIRSSEHMAASGVFALLMVVGALKYLYTLIPKEQFKQLLIVGGLAAAAIVFSAALLLPYEAVIAPWSGRIYALWDANHGKTIPLVASVNEHKPTTWTRHFCDLHVLVCAFPVGLWYCIKHINDERVFVALYAISAAYFAGVMVRLMLTLTPVVCVLAGIAFSILLDLIVPRPMRRDEIPVQLIEDNDDFKNVYDKEEPQSGCLHSPFQHDPGLGMIARWSTLIALMVLMSLFSKHCTWITNNNYSHSSNVYESWAGKHTILDDYREAYGWLSRNTPDNATIMSWWDYGYLIAGLGNRTSVIDNNTWNNTHIALVGKAMASNESVAYEVMTALSVDYVLITFGGFVGFSSDCVAKFLWPVRIAQGEFPKDIRERDYLTASGSYQIGSGGTKAVFNSLLFKLAYYKYNSGGDPPALDRVRGTTPGTIGFKLTYLEEAYTTENWLIRIYRVKKPHEFNRPRLARFERKILLRRPVSKKTLKSRQGQLKAQPTVVKGKIATRLQ